MNYDAAIINALLNAIWAKGHTPWIHVLFPEAVVGMPPKDNASSEMLALNLRAEAITNFSIDEERLTFTTRFDGAAHMLFIPLAVVTIVSDRTADIDIPLHRNIDDLLEIIRCARAGGVSYTDNRLIAYIAAVQAGGSDKVQQELDLILKARPSFNPPSDTQHHNVETGSSKSPTLEQNSIEPDAAVVNVIDASSRFRPR